MNRFALLAPLFVASVIIIIGAVYWASDLSLYLRSQIIPPSIGTGTITKRLSWTPPLDTSSQNKTITIVASDDHGNKTTRDITIQVLPKDESFFHDITIIPQATEAKLTFIMAESGIPDIELGVSSQYLHKLVQQSEQNQNQHQVTLKGLFPCTRYYLRLRALSQVQNKDFQSADQPFSTLGCAGNAVIEQTTQADITPQGGTVALETLATIEAPPTFATQDATFQIQKLQRDQALAAIGKPANKEAISGLFFLGAFTGPQTSLLTFNQPVKVTLAYTPAENTQAGTIGLYRFDGSSWQQLTSNCNLNTETRTITCDTAQFSVFGVFGQGGSTEDPSPQSDGGGGGGGGESGGGGGEEQPEAPVRTYTFQAEKGHLISGPYSGVEPAGKTVVIASKTGLLQRMLRLPRDNYYLDVTVRHDRPGPVHMVVDLQTAGRWKAWKVIKLDKNDNRYYTHRLGLLRDFALGGIRFRFLNDTYDRNNPTNADKDRNLHIDAYRFSTR